MQKERGDDYLGDEDKNGPGNANAQTSDSYVRYQTVNSIVKCTNDNTTHGGYPEQLAIVHEREINKVTAAVAGAARGTMNKGQPMLRGCGGGYAVRRGGPARRAASRCGCRSGRCVARVRRLSPSYWHRARAL